MVHASIFSGIGGPEVAAAMLGWDNAFHCEINPFGRRVLEYWFPESRSYEDITKTDFKEWRGKIDILTGGFPCQPFSYAGKRGGREDDRYLWPQMLRAIDEIRPTWVVGENVAGITTMVEGGVLSPMGAEATLFGEGGGVHRYGLKQSFTIERICRDLEQLGYDVQPMLIPAAAVGAPHRRDRVFIIAYAQDTDHDGRSKREYAEQGDKRDKRDFGSRDTERVCGEERVAAADSYKHRGGEMDKHLQPQFADGAEPFGNGGQRDAADTHSQGQQESKCAGRQEDTAKEGARSDNRIERFGGNGDFADTVCEGFQGQDKPRCQEGEERMHLRRNPAGHDWEGLRPEERWAEFPTVSPVHRGNDGIPFRMDGASISFTKWRTESIKAYGNAIVTQVMYRIFQAINQLNTKDI